MADNKDNRKNKSRKKGGKNYNENDEMSKQDQSFEERGETDNK